MAEQHEVVIIGAGTTGAAAAYHLAQAGVGNILCLDMGAVGQGRTEPSRVPAGTPLIAGEEAEYAPHNSGSAVFEGGPKGPRTIKMIVTLPPYLTPLPINTAGMASRPIWIWRSGAAICSWSWRTGCCPTPASKSSSADR
jgi:hypothetical protein